MRGWIVGAMSCVLAGCLMSNPDWDGVDEDGASTGKQGPQGSSDGTPPSLTTGPSAGSAGGSGDSDPNRETGDTGEPVGGSTDGGPEPVTMWYPAVLAYCMSDVTLDVEACTVNRSSDGQLLLSDTGTETIAIFLKFELDAELAGQTVTRADVALTVVEPSDNPGSLFQIEPFTLDTLTMGFPDPGGRPLAQPEGPAEADALMWFPIPDEVAETTGSLYFGLYPDEMTTMSYGGTMYLEPPQLVVTYAPP